MKANHTEGISCLDSVFLKDNETQTHRHTPTHKHTPTRTHTPTHTQTPTHTHTAAQTSHRVLQFKRGDKTFSGCVAIGTTLGNVYCSHLPNTLYSRTSSVGGIKEHIDDELHVSTEGVVYDSNFFRANRETQAGAGYSCITNRMFEGASNLKEAQQCALRIGDGLSYEFVAHVRLPVTKVHLYIKEAADDTLYVWLIVSLSNFMTSIYRKSSTPSDATQSGWNVIFFLQGHAGLPVFHSKCNDMCFCSHIPTMISIIDLSPLVASDSNHADYRTVDLIHSEASRVQMYPHICEAHLTPGSIQGQPNDVRAVGNAQFVTILHRTVRLHEKRKPSVALAGHNATIYMCEYDGCRRLATIDTKEHMIVWDMKRVCKLFSVYLIPLTTSPRMKAHKVARKIKGAKKDKYESSSDDGFDDDTHTHTEESADDMYIDSTYLVDTCTQPPAQIHTPRNTPKHTLVQERVGGGIDQGTPQTHLNKDTQSKDKGAASTYTQQFGDKSDRPSFADIAKHKKEDTQVVAKKKKRIPTGFSVKAESAYNLPEDVQLVMALSDSTKEFTHTDTHTTTHAGTTHTHTDQTIAPTEETTPNQAQEATHTETNTFRQEEELSYVLQNMAVSDGMQTYDFVQAQAVALGSFSTPTHKQKHKTAHDSFVFAHKLYQMFESRNEMESVLKRSATARGPRGPNAQSREVGAVDIRPDRLAVFYTRLNAWQIWKFV